VSDVPVRVRPTPDITLVFHPQRDTSYVHFLDAEAHPFDPSASRLGRRNAWWLADAALLSYWPPDEALARYARVGFQAEPVFDGTTQCYLAWNDSAVLVSFRGTEPGEPGDLLDDLVFALGPWDRAGHVHLGFKVALDRVWNALSARLAALAPARTVWFTGHSLGGALAALAADRYDATAGVCTLGAPRVGDWHFAASHTRLGSRALRYVNDADIVTHLPPPLPYQHAGTPRFIDPTGHVSDHRPGLHHYFEALVGDVGHVREVRLALDRGHLRHAPDFLLDHMPRAYAVDIWNDYARFGD
jgi:hypothetical protein